MSSTFSLEDWSSLAAIITASTAIILALASLLQIKEMRKAREDEYSPHIRAFLNMVETTIASLRFVNIGRSPACDLYFEIDFMKMDTVVDSRIYEQDTMLPSDDRDLILPQMQFKVLLDAFTDIVVSGSYTNGFGKKYNLNQTIDVKSFVDSVNSAKILMRSKDKIL
jgi:hypothetical protein